MTKPLRVLQVVTRMDRGGLESRLMDLYRAIDRERVQFDFYVLRPEAGCFDEEITALGGRIFVGQALSTSRIPQIPGQFKAFFRAHPEYSVCHCHLNQWCGLILSGAKAAGVNVRIAHSRTALSGGGGSVFVKNAIRHIGASAPTHRFAVSEKAARWLFGDRRVDAGLCEVLPNAIESRKFLFDPALREQKRAELHLGDAYTVLHVGNLRPMKNHPFLFRVFSEIRKSVPTARLLLAGDGELRGELEQLARETGIGDAVTFLGKRADIPALLSAADVFIFPSLFEGLPGSVLEAQAASLPCLIADTIAPEVVLSDLAEALSLSLSPEVWAQKALETRTHVRGDESALFARTGYDAAALAQRMVSFYENVTR